MKSEVYFGGKKRSILWLGGKKKELAGGALDKRGVMEEKEQKEQEDVFKE